MDKRARKLLSPWALRARYRIPLAGGGESLRRIGIRKRGKEREKVPLAPPPEWGYGIKKFPGVKSRGGMMSPVIDFRARPNTPEWARYPRRRAFIVGASGGIDGAIATTLARDGVRIVLGGHDLPRLDDLAVSLNRVCRDRRGPSRRRPIVSRERRRMTTSQDKSPV